MSNIDLATSPPPRFAVLDIVRISHHGNPTSSAARGTVLGIRHYRDRGYCYSVGHDELGGILDDAMLAPTGHRDTIDSFWHPPLRKGDVVRISNDCPEPEWRGFFGVVAECFEGAHDEYGVMFTSGVGFRRETTFEALPTTCLVPTGERIPPEPVPRAVTTYRLNGDRGVRPTHEFTIVDEIDQYL